MHFFMRIELMISLEFGQESYQLGNPTRFTIIQYLFVWFCKLSHLLLLHCRLTNCKFFNFKKKL